MAFFKHTCYRHIHHILTFHTSGDTWPAAFYLLFFFKVTGANKGIGYAIVRGLCKQFDGDVYLTGKDPR